MHICFALMLAGIVLLVFSRVVEQSAIKSGSVAVKKVLDDVNASYSDSPHRLTWTVRVHVQNTSKAAVTMSKAMGALHLNTGMGKTWASRPVITIFALRSENEAGAMTDWTLPAAYMNGLSDLLVSDSVNLATHSSASQSVDDSPIRTRV